MPWRPTQPDEYPTLGWGVLQWMRDNLAAPDRMDYEPLILTREQAQYVLQLYRLDPETCRRVYRRSVLSTPKGWGSSPMLAMLCAAESLADVVPDGWDAQGQPVGRSWSSLRIVESQLAAVSEGQTGNSFKRLLGMIRLGPVMDNYPGIDPMNTFVVLPDSGRIAYVTSAASSHEGNPIIFGGLDQTEAWTPGNGGVRFASVLRRNVAKNDGLTIEAPNAYRPGERSVAEASAEAAKTDKSILYVHKQAPRVKELEDTPKLRKALETVYGESNRDRGGWVNLDRIIADIYDPDTDESEARQYYLNEPVAPENTWIYAADWAPCTSEDAVEPGEAIVIGFDGAQYDDSTAMIGCRISDGYLFVLGIWERPLGQDGVNWEVDRELVETVLESAFEIYDVRLMWPDPWGDWRPYVDRWAAKWPGRVVEFDTRHKTKMCRALELFSADVKTHTLTHDGNPVFAQHIANARKKRYGEDLYTISKDQRKSPRKIDGAVAATLAYAARAEALDMPAPSSGRVYAFR